MDITGPLKIVKHLALTCIVYISLYKNECMYLKSVKDYTRGLPSENDDQFPCCAGNQKWSKKGSYCARPLIEKRSAI